MRKYNVIMVFSPDYSKILMCKRRKDPYIGLLNLVGGKLEEDENSLSAAYRELYEETNISHKDIELHHFMDLTYCLSGFLLEVYAGKLKHSVEVSGDENELFWIDAKSNFFDFEVFAGKGNIGHMLEMLKPHMAAL
jgi:8-oxo-dGTP diphosphatase